MSQTRANFLMLIASLIWGTAFVSQTTGMGTIGPFTFSFSRFFFATIAVLPVALYFEANNFSTMIKDHQNLQKVKEQHSIKPKYQSCHTAVSQDGYVFEGHIPSKFIKQFLANPEADAIGLAVPGMPLGSPGMEVEGRFMPYDVLVLYKDGSSKVYAEVREG